jgi:hypothetical protein
MASTAPQRYPSTVPPTRVYTLSNNPNSNGMWPVQKFGPYNWQNKLFIVCLYVSGGTYYVTIFRSIDKGLIWTESDTANRKATTAEATSAYKLISPMQYGNLLYVAHNNVVKVEQFDMNLNIWGATVATGGPTITPNGVGRLPKIFLERRTDDSFVLLYGAQQSVGGTQYGRVKYVTLTGSTWSGENSITAHGASDFIHDGPTGIRRGASDRVHMFFTSSETGDGQSLFHVSLSSGGSLDTYAEVGGSAKCYTSASSDSTQPVGAPLYINSKLYVPFLKWPGAGTRVIVASASSGANPVFTLEEPPGYNSTATRDYAPFENIFGAFLCISEGSTSIGIEQSDNVDDDTGLEFDYDQIHYLDLPLENGDSDEVILFVRQGDPSDPPIRSYYVYSRRSTAGTWAYPKFVYAARGLWGINAGPTEDCVHPAPAASARIRYAGVGLT